MARRLRFSVLLFLLLCFGSEGLARSARYLSFSAKDRNGVFLRDLKMHEVSLLLDGTPQEIRFFGYRSVETAFVFLIENSPRTAQYNVSMPHLGRINTVDRIRYHLLEGMMEEFAKVGNALIAQFDQELEILQDFTDQEHLLSQALLGMRPRPDAVTLDEVPVGRMLGRGVDLLRDRPEKRKILVLFTASIDRESVNDLDEYRSMFRLSDIDLYAVSFAPGFTTGGGFSHAERINRFYFNKLIEETGGRFYLSGRYVFPSEFMNDLKSSLAHSYTIGFYVEPGDDWSERRIKIKIDRPNCEISHRNKIVF